MQVTPETILYLKLDTAAPRWGWQRQGGVLLPPWARADRAVKCPHTPSLAPIYSRPIPFQWREFASDVYRVSIVTSTPHKSSNYKKVNEGHVKWHSRLTLKGGKRGIAHSWTTYVHRYTSWKMNVKRNISCLCVLLYWKEWSTGRRWVESTWWRGAASDCHTGSNQVLKVAFRFHSF